MATAVDTPRYVSRRRGTMELYCDNDTFDALVAEGRIGTLEPIGKARRKYNWDDIQALKAAAIRPATATA